MSVFKRNSVFAGRYFLEELIGEGGFSEVWRVHDTMADNAVVAVKIYAPEKGLDDYGIRQFRQEYSITHPLSHPHLMKVYYFDIADGSPYLIMPYFKLGSLAKQIHEKDSFSEKEIALLMCQIGGALVELHEQQPPILHQDIKPDNILLQKTDHFVLTDFGISSNTRQTLRRSTTKLKPLTISYAPPERFDRSPVSNTAGDVFSLGVTLYEMCTGQIPWDGNGGQILLKGAHIPALPAHFPKELSRMIEACMASDWSKRPSAEQILNWGKFYLEQGYWRFENLNPKKAAGIKRYAIPILAIAGLILVCALIITSLNSKTVAKKKEIKISDLNTTANTPTTIAESVSENTTGPSKDLTTPGKTAENTKIEEKGKKDLAEKPSKVKIIPIIRPKNEFSQPTNLKEYLNKITDRKVPRDLRNKWKAEALQLFANPNVEVINEKDGLGDRNTADYTLDILMDIPHKVEIDTVEKNSQQKITKLVLQLEPIKLKDLPK